MYFPHTSVFPNRAYSSRRFVDEELHKAKSSISSLAKIVAFSVVLIVMTVAGLSGLGLVTMQIQNTTDNTIEATKQDVQANLGDLTALKNRIEQLEKSDQQMASSATTITDAVAMDINSLKDEVSKLSNNQSESRGHVEKINNLVQGVQKSQNASEIASRDTNRQLQTLTKTLLEVQEKQNAPVQQVAFTVFAPSGKLIGLAPLFQYTVLNEGGAYNTETGLFTCQVKGMYLFTLTLVSSQTRTSVIHCDLFRNKNPTTTAWNQEGLYETASFAIVLHLFTDDVVRLDCYNWEEVDHNFGTIYAGVLIRAD